MAETHEAMESHIKSAILSRSSYFQQQADSLTFEGVRRLLEKDLGLEVHALDSHKRFVKQWLQNCIESASDDKMTKSEGASGENAISSAEDKPVNEPEVKKESENPNSGGGDILEDSPVMGLLTGTKKVKAEANGAEETKAAAAPSEASIKKAIWGRASYLRENSQTITLAGLRRLLEEDLELEKHSLDSFKKFVSQQVDEVLNTPESPPKTVIDKKKTVKKGSHGKVPPKASKEESPTTSGDESDDVSEEVNMRKTAAPRAKTQKSVAVKKRKRPEEDPKGTKRKQSKASKSVSEESGDEDGGDASENENSETSTEKPVKRKEVPKPSYGKQVEHLKSVIKSCGLSIPPVVYKKVKQAPEKKRESCLIKELEELLSKEGLSSNPSEKDVKDVKKRKERAKELEGIDMSNIVVSSRRRSATSFAPPPKPVIPDISESESEESEDEDDDEEEGADEEVEDEEVAGEDQEDGSDEAPSEESDKDNSGSD